MWFDYHYGIDIWNTWKEFGDSASQVRRKGNWIILGEMKGRLAVRQKEI